MQQHPVGRVENYTTPFLVSVGVLLFNTLVLLWAVYGLLAALLIAGFVNLLIGRLKPRT